MRRAVFDVWLLLVVVCASGQANGKPQPNFSDVGQGALIPVNLEDGTTAQAGKTLHNRCSK